MLEVACPKCGTMVPWNETSKWRPFCSERCRLIDLGQWFSEEHAIPGEAEDFDELLGRERDSSES